MILYFSGSAGSTKGLGRTAEPEHVLQDNATIMLSYALIRKKHQEQDQRFEEICKVRKQRKKGKRK